jgi:hypothetical protein
MFKTTEMPIATQEGESPSGFASDAELQNLVLVPNPQGSPKPFTIFNTPGLTSKDTTGAGNVRGMLIHDDITWIVRGTVLYRTADGSTLDQVAVTAVSGTNAVVMVGAGYQQILVLDPTTGNLWLCDTTTITAIVHPITFPGLCVGVTWMDGYTIIADGLSDSWFISGIDDPTTWDPLDFSTADAISDTLRYVVTLNRDLLLAGGEHMEIWYNAGASPFPFLRGSPGVIELGIFAPLYAKKHNSRLYFIGSDRRVYRLDGYTPTPISTPWVERLIATGINRTTGHASVYQMHGQDIYSMSCTVDGSAGAVEYNITTGLWQTRKGLAGRRATFTPVTGTDQGKTLALHAGAGLASTGLFQLAPDTADLDGIITCPAHEAANRRVFEAEAELSMQRTDGEGTVAYSFSNDNGATYHTRATQTINRQRQRFHRNGSYLRRIRRFTVSNPGKRIAIDGVYARIEVGQ